jgi:hypothetical protein
MWTLSKALTCNALGCNACNALRRIVSCQAKNRCWQHQRCSTDPTGTQLQGMQSKVTACKLHAVTWQLLHPLLHTIHIKRHQSSEGSWLTRQVAAPACQCVVVSFWPPGLSMKCGQTLPRDPPAPPADTLAASAARHCCIICAGAGGSRHTRSLQSRRPIQVISCAVGAGSSSSSRGSNQLLWLPLV